MGSKRSTVTVTRAETQRLTADCRQAITTHYIGPTDRRGSRIVAQCEARRIVVGCDDSLDIAGNHAAAALQLFRAMGWDAKERLVMGGTKDGYVFVQIPKSK